MAKRRTWKRLKGETVAEWSARVDAYNSPEAIAAKVEERRYCQVCGAEYAPMATRVVCRRCYRQWLKDRKVWR